MMKRIMFAVIAALTVMTSLSSCEEKVTATYWIQFDEGSSNFSANLNLQNKAGNEISFDIETLENSFFGSEADAVSWFNGKMDYLESDEFATSEPEIPVLEGTEATFCLISTYEGDMDGDGINEGQKISTRTVTFKEHNIL